MQATERSRCVECVALFAALLVLVALPLSAAAGDLNPTGAPASTMKPLSQVEPRTPITNDSRSIVSSGSYYFTGDLTVSSGVGISVYADNVTIDLMGFSLIGGGSSTDGIDLRGHSKVEIRNGTIRGFGQNGINGGNPSGNENRIIGMKVLSSGSTGILLTLSSTEGSYSLVQDCSIGKNGGYGIWAGYASIIKNNIVYENGYAGIESEGYGSRVEGNTVFQNGAATANAGISFSALGGVIQGNTSYWNGGHGIDVKSGPATVIGNTAYYNGYAGIRFAATGYSLYDQNTAVNNDRTGSGFKDLTGCTASCTAGTNYFGTTGPNP